MVAGEQVPGIRRHFRALFSELSDVVSSRTPGWGCMVRNTVEYEMRHMDRLFGELQRRGARTFEVTNRQTPTSSIG